MPEPWGDDLRPVWRHRDGVVLTQEGGLRHGSRGDGERLMPGCDGAAAFQPSDALLDHSASSVALRIEGAGAALAHVAALAGREGSRTGCDGDADTQPRAGLL